MEKQIEEIAKIMCHGCSHKCDDTSGCIVEDYAEAIYTAGYRRQSEVIDEFAKKLKEAPIKCGIPLLGLSTKEEIEEYFNGIMLQVRDAIDSIAKEMKGAEDGKQG
jgi:hypothetical protein